MRCCAVETREKETWMLMKSTDIFQQTLHGELLRKDQCSEVYFAHDNKVQS